MIKKFKSLTKFSRIMFFICVGILVTSITLLCLSGVLDHSEQMVSTLVFNTVQSLLMIVLILVPLFFRKATHLVIPWPIEIIYVVFCSLCLICGEIGEFYNKIKWWDSFLHTLSGVLIGALGYIFINTIDKSNKNEIKLTPIFTSILVMMFVMSVGYLWEIFEWWADELTGSNMQRYLESGSPTIGGGVPLVGHAALADTMKDLMLNILGGLGIAIYGFFQMKHDKKGLTTLALEPDIDINEKNIIEVNATKEEENVLEEDKIESN